MLPSVTSLFGFCVSWGMGCANCSLKNNEQCAGNESGTKMAVFFIIRMIIWQLYEMQCHWNHQFLSALFEDSSQIEYCSIFHCSSVCPCTGVTSQLFSIIWWFRAWKPCIFWKHVIPAIFVHEPNPLGPSRPTPWPWDPLGLPLDPQGPSKPTPWPPVTLSAYPLTPWDPVGLPLDPLGPSKPTPWPPLPY